MITFNIADTDICWLDSDYTPELGMFCPAFLKESSPDENALCFSAKVQPLEFFQNAPILHEDTCYHIIRYGGERFYLYNPDSPNERFVVPYSRLKGEKQNEILFCDGFLQHSKISVDRLCGFCGLCKLLMEREIAVLHASYIDIGGEALLFAAPSGTGKSTQAELWEKYAGAEIINGDRVAIALKNGRYHAYGYPACGSSNICINRTLPIRAIIVLEQGLDNRVLPMTPGEKFRACLSGMVINAWEAEETRLAMDLAEKWLEAIPIYRLSCRPDEDAVLTLRRFLEENP